jgi:hypothetical protein
MSSKLAIPFRHQLKIRAQSDGWRVTTNNLHRLILERRNAEGVQQTIIFTPVGLGWNEDTDAPEVRINVQGWIVFDSLEAKIDDILRIAGLPEDLSDRRSASFHVTALKRPGDPDLSSGIPLAPVLDAAQQADTVWDFFAARAMPLLDRLQSPNALQDLTAPAPGGAHFSWSTRRMLWRALQGDHSMARSIAAQMQASAPEDLTSGIRGLLAHAAAHGDTLLLRPGALDYTTAPVWQEFVAVRDAALRMNEHQP